MAKRTIIRDHLPDVAEPPFKSLGDFIISYSTKHGSKVAYIDSATDKKYTFNDLVDHSQRICTALIDRGLKKGDVVCIFSPNCMEYLLLVAGIICAGGVPTTANPLYTQDELLHQLHDSNPKLLVCGEANAGVAKRASIRYGGIKEIFVFGTSPGCTPVGDLINVKPRPFPHIQYDIKNDIALLPYSSGTTGRPKGVMLTHYNLLYNVFQFIDPMIRLGITEGSQTFLLVLPLFHAYGLSAIFLNAIYSGSTVVFLQGFDVDNYLRCVEKYRVTVLHLVPPMAVLLCKHPKLSSFDLSSVREGFCGAAPLGKDTAEELMKKTKIKTIRQGWGMTETSPVAIMSPLKGWKHGSVGIPVNNTEAKVVDLETGTDLPANKEGELYVRGPQIMKGYLNRPDVTRECLDVEGWLHTGDIAYYDEDEHFYVVDRCKELIKYKGFQVAPADLEDLLLTHPAVADAAVIGVADQLAGELPKAYVVLKTGQIASEHDIVTFVQERCAPHKRLRGGVEFINEVPKSASGKILRRLLREKATNIKSKL